MTSTALARRSSWRLELGTMAWLTGIPAADLVAARRRSVASTAESLAEDAAFLERHERCAASMNDLVRRAQEQGLRIRYAALGRGSGYLMARGLILLNASHCLPALRETLAHELGHWHHGHDWTVDASHCERDELEADAWAARTLISEPELVTLQVRLDGDVAAMARALTVTKRLVMLAIAMYSTRAAIR